MNACGTTTTESESAGGASEGADDAGAGFIGAGVPGGADGAASGDC
ncbi:hypothetical protein PI125_g26948 [Phytophthora idaei]|nr:hypothetical protein PI125_g26948 [Phytophthora idaei]